MILRHWKGIAKAAQADKFALHLKTVTFPQVAKIGGFVRGTVTRRDIESGVEFLVLTEWETLAAISSSPATTLSWPSCRRSSRP